MVPYELDQVSLAERMHAVGYALVRHGWGARYQVRIMHGGRVSLTVGFDRRSVPCFSAG